MPFRQLKSFFKILIGVQYQMAYEEEILRRNPFDFRLSSGCSATHDCESKEAGH